MSGQQAWKGPVTAVSTTLADLGHISDFGKTRVEANGNSFMLVKATAAALVEGEAVVLSSITSSEYIVVHSADLLKGVFGLAQTAVAASSYFWVQVGGIANAISDDAVAVPVVQELVQVGGTDGRLELWVPATGTPVGLALTTAAAAALFKVKLF